MTYHQCTEQITHHLACERRPAKTTPLQTTDKSVDFRATEHNLSHPTEEVLLFRWESCASLMHLLRYYCAGRHPYEWHAICSPIIVLVAEHSRTRPRGHVHKLNPSRAPVWSPNYSPPLETNGHIPRILRIMRLLCKSNNCFLVHNSPHASFPVCL